MPVLIVDGDLVGFCLLHYKLRVKILFLFLVGQSARCLHIVALEALGLAGDGLGCHTSRHVIRVETHVLRVRVAFAFVILVDVFEFEQSPTSAVVWAGRLETGVFSLLFFQVLDTV